MKTTSIKGVLSFCVGGDFPAAKAVMAYSAVTVKDRRTNAATEKAVKESQAIGSEVSTDALRMENTRHRYRLWWTSLTVHHHAEN